MLSDIFPGLNIRFSIRIVSANAAKRLSAGPARQGIIYIVSLCLYKTYPRGGLFRMKQGSGSTAFLLRGQASLP
ncbi:hypothetical protein XB02_12600 [Pantoea ananatis]|nr:hypothetical protein XB02_12600 [Pantoea ananatis]